MNIAAGTVLLDEMHYREHSRVRELLIEQIQGDNVHVHTLSGQQCAKIVSARYFEHDDDWSHQGYWATDTTSPIRPIEPPTDRYAVRRMEYHRTVLKLTNTAQVEFSLVPSLAPDNWEAYDDRFRLLRPKSETPGGMPSTVRFLDFTYHRRGALRRLVYRRNGQRWLLVRTLITPGEIPRHR